MSLPRACTVLGALAAFAAAPAVAVPNGSSFAEAKGSAVDYTKPVVEQPPASCRSLLESGAPHDSILSARAIDRGSDTPAMCVVRGVISPEVQYIAYLPRRWNGRLYMHGNGGYAGEALDEPAGHRARLRAARLGFVAAFTNTGHDAAVEPGAIWGYEDVQKEIDFGFRAVHLTAVAVKRLARAYYGRSPAHAYFDGCSTGGLQGFAEAQRFPGDFDGILAGAPVFDLTHMLWQYWQNQMAIERTPLSREKLELLGELVLERFDEADGLADGVIGNPLAVNFDPRRDLPRAGPGGRGFTGAEIDTLAAIYGPVRAGASVIYPRTVIGGEAPGLAYAGGDWTPAPAESAWEGRVVPDRDGELGQRSALASWFRYLAFETDDPARDWRTLDPERDLPRTQRARRIFDATDPHLGRFHRRGGRMIVYHGWGDFGVNPLRTIEYYEEVAAVMGAAVAQFLRLYLIPGMYHCRGGVNVDRFDLMTPLIDWVEGGRAPAGLYGKRVERGNVIRTRPLCAYPRVARYEGTGPIDEHESFQCSAPSE